MTSSDDGGYVHDPAAFDGDGSTDDADAIDDHDAPHPAEVDREFGWRGWVLVGVMILAFIVAPLAILLLPPFGGDYYFFMLLIFPLLPAALLAVTAVWATTRP
ncbi:hypothetical protein [Natrialbaceae archaeon AArc-T1-2]|uniref:hypothetical protein n=1 Tax=Natrialbaceae archaeon AArc-T1-2 TaxID=3053904 RepID=UPI00255AA98F|nr:hypothetical protein [Natrialbaceae archaeon AArc-T1-2]WIV68460.1 hypothetical protein QQ977_06995 [Natrialbaceae archaeon AArc-T1-2]